jgi:beta-phosphoglucomutase
VTGPGGVLWDLDGTLVDSGDQHWRAWREVMRADGVELTYASFLASFGQRNDRILMAWLGRDVPADRIGRLGDAKEALYRDLAQREGIVVLPGARHWVVRLRAAGWRQAIASSAPRANVDVLLAAAGLHGLIDAIVSAEDVRNGKPEPDVFLAAAAALHIPPSRCVVVEDAAAGVEAARRAGMRSIGVNRDVTLPADVAVRSLTDLSEDAFERLLASGADARSNF